MATVRYVHLWCDECSEWIDRHTAREARVEARKEGWPHVALPNEFGRPLDFCSDACKTAHDEKVSSE